MLDVIVVGGGPAGLQTALTLGRGGRRVALVDTGPPRNARATHIHNFITRDATPPDRFREIARAELLRYGVSFRDQRVAAIDGSEGDFAVRLETEVLRARRIVLAVGVVDVLPELPGLHSLWGETVFQCPYCHGYELRDLRWAIYLPGASSFEPALLARNWSDDVIALTDGHTIDAELEGRLLAVGVRVEPRRIRSLEAASSGRLGTIRFTLGPPLPRDALMLKPLQRQTDLVLDLGLELDSRGYVVIDHDGLSSRPGIYAAGDLTTPMQSALAAASAGQKVASRLNRILTAELLGWTG